MKTTVSVVVLQPFEWKGQHYVPGQSAILTPIDAVVLTKKHLVTLTRRKVVAPIPEPEPPAPPPVEPPKYKRGYRRRDLQAEETTEFPPPAATVVGPGVAVANESTSVFRAPAAPDPVDPEF